MAPRIGEADPQIHGLIILAGSARPFEDVILDQMNYVLSLSMPDPVVRQQQLAARQKQVALVKDPKRLPTAAATDCHSSSGCLLARLECLSSERKWRKR